MKKGISITLTLCILLSMLSMAVSAQDTEIIFKPAHDTAGEGVESNTDRMTVSLMSETESLPSSFDARDKGWVTPLKTQTMGNCWAYSAISALESYNISQNLDDINADYSEMHLTWFGNTKTGVTTDPTYGDGLTVEAPYERGGFWQDTVGALAKWSGIADEKDFPTSQEPVEYSDSYRYNTGSEFIIKSAECMTNTNDIKKWIMQYGSVAVSFSIRDKCIVDSDIVYWNYEATTLGHSVAIIGWDDSFPMRKIFEFYDTELDREDLMPPADGAWLCKDSSGRYAWLSYYDLTLNNFVGYTAQSADNYRDNYTYNGAGYMTAARVATNVLVANVFQADEYELLSAVSTYTISAGQTLNIGIYKNLKSDYSNPMQGTLALTHSTTIDNAGYHTIELPEDVALEPDEYFSVVIEVVAVDGWARFPVERNAEFEASYGMAYSSEPGQSYVYMPKYSSWYTSEGFGIENVLIQAFTNCNHQPENTVTDATCENDGLDYSICSQCSEILKNDTLPATGHSTKNSEWIYTGSNTFEKKCDTCEQPAESKDVYLTLNSSSLEIYNQGSDKLIASVTDDFTDKIIFTSSDDTVVSVDESGNINALSVGNATVTATIENTSISAQCVVTVLPRTFTVTWVSGDDVVEKQLSEGLTIETPDAPQKAGYKFIGWTPHPNSMPSENITITAIFEKSYACPDCGDEILGEDNITAHIAAEARMKATVEIRNNSGTKTINYGETLNLTAITTNMPENTSIHWFVDGIKEGEGETFNISFKNGTKTIEVKLVDAEGNVLTNANGEEISDTQTVKVNASFWQKIISFFKDLFRVSRIIVQSLEG